MPRKGSLKVSGYERRVQVKNTTRPGTHTKVIRVDPYFRRPAPLPAPPIPAGYHFRKGYTTKTGKYVPGKIVSNPAPKGIARLRELMQEKKPGSRVVRESQAHFGSNYTPRDAKRTSVKIEGFEKEIVKYTDPIPGEVIQIVYMPNGDVEIWIAKKTPKRRLGIEEEEEDLESEEEE
jgi:hypothetical protein